MSGHNELRIDTGHARRLAADLAHSGQPRPAPPPPLPDSPGTRRFLTAAAAAVDTTLRRAEATRRQARELAESSFDSVLALEDADASFRSDLGKL